MVVPAVGRRSAAAAVLGVVGLGIGAALVLSLAFIPPTDRISVTRRTISEYGLSDNKWLFNVAVLLVVAGSALIMGALWRARRLPVAAVVLGALWVLGLLCIVAVPKANWAVTVGFSASGTIHRFASFVAFLCLPFAVLSAARPVFAEAPRRRFTVRLFAVLSLAWFAVILGAIAIAALDHQRWWMLIPLGLVERGMALTELVALALLALPDATAVVTAAAPAGSSVGGR
ncbi:MAG TPA: DUF998 domain-containing protein [Pseudonocardiaceae bacterium]|nr:DUF998 domain-containing protein [Pseudonocardiaceae bacterium]